MVFEIKNITTLRLLSLYFFPEKLVFLVQVLQVIPFQQKHLGLPTRTFVTQKFWQETSAFPIDQGGTIGFQDTGCVRQKDLYIYIFFVFWMTLQVSNSQQPEPAFNSCGSVTKAAKLLSYEFENEIDMFAHLWIWILDLCSDLHWQI